MQTEEVVAEPAQREEQRPMRGYLESMESANGHDDRVIAALRAYDVTTAALPLERMYYPD